MRSVAPHRFIPILLVLLFLMAGLSVVLRSQERVENPDPHRFDEEIDRFLKWDRQNAVPAEGVLFIGSSSIRGWMTREYFPELPVINRGFGGSHLSDVIYFAGKIALPYRPEVVVIYAGDNDVAAGKPAGQVVDDFQTLAQMLQDSLPGVAIIYLPIKPSLARWQMWPEMKKANEAIHRLIAQDPKMYDADTVSPMFMDNGELNPALFIEDGLHLTPAGYQLWSEVLAPVIAEAQGALKPE